jgi:hypothetical protein
MSLSEGGTYVVGPRDKADVFRTHAEAQQGNQ